MSCWFLLKLELFCFVYFFRCIVNGITEEEVSSSETCHYNNNVEISELFPRWIVESRISHVGCVIICFIHIDKRAFTKQVINKQEMCLPYSTSSLEWNLILRNETFNIQGFFYKQLSCLALKLKFAKKKQQLSNCWGSKIHKKVKQLRLKVPLVLSNFQCPKRKWGKWGKHNENI